MASGPGTGTWWRPSWMNVSPLRRVTWLVVMAAMRDSGCPYSRSRSRPTRSVGSSAVSCSSRAASVHRWSWLMAGPAARGGGGMLSGWQWPRAAAQARKSLARQADGRVRSPLVDVGLLAGVQRGAAVAEPGEQVRGGADVIAGVRGGVRGRAAAAAPARSLRITCQVA